MLKQSQAEFRGLVLVQCRALQLVTCDYLQSCGFMVFLHVQSCSGWLREFEFPLRFILGGVAGRRGFSYFPIIVEPRCQEEARSGTVEPLWIFCLAMFYSEADPQELLFKKKFHFKTNLYTALPEHLHEFSSVFLLRNSIHQNRRRTT
jgi:hypothetical protein